MSPVQRRRIEEMFNDAMSEHLFERRRQRGEAVTREQVHREYLDRPDRAANILASMEEQCQWLRDTGFRDVDCFWKYFELAIFGGCANNGDKNADRAGHRRQRLLGLTMLTRAPARAFAGASGKRASLQEVIGSDNRPLPRWLDVSRRG